MFDAEYWTVGRGSDELESFREVLHLYRWVMEISIEEGGGMETWFPPEEHRRSTPGVSLSAKHRGFWSTMGRDNNEIVDASPESLDRYLARAQPRSRTPVLLFRPRNSVF